MPGLGNREKVFGASSGVHSLLPSPVKESETCPAGHPGPKMERLVCWKREDRGRISWDLTSVGGEIPCIGGRGSGEDENGGVENKSG